MSSPASIPELVTIVHRHAERYRRFGARIAPPHPPSPDAAYDRYLFALLSRRCALDRTVRAFRLLRGKDHTDEASLTVLLRDGRIGYHNTWPA